MSDPIAQASRAVARDPSLSVRAAAEKWKVPKSTVQDRVSGKHGPSNINGSRHLSIEQEAALIAKINDYAVRGTLLAPRHVAQLARRLCEEGIGKNWASTFFRRHKAELHSNFFIFEASNRRKADTPETRAAFYHMVKDAYELHHPKTHNIYNVDKSPFNLTPTRRLRRVAGKDPTHHTQASLSRHGMHITVVACIGVSEAPVQPMVVYQGKGRDLLEYWTSASDPDIPQTGYKTHSGYMNATSMMDWLDTVFDRYSKALADDGRDVRILFLDGADIHIQVEFLESCIARNIIPICFPPHMTHRLQPLDVNFFRNLKGKYAEELDNYIIDSELETPSLGMFWGWHQRAWKSTANSRQLRAAWRDSGLWPLKKSHFIEDRVITPPPAHQISSDGPDTPETNRIARANMTGVRRHEIDPAKAFLKTSKALEIERSKVVLLESQLEGYQAAKKLQEGVGTSRKKNTFPVGAVFDPKYQEEHQQELAERKAREVEAKEKRRRENAAEGSKRKQSRPNFVQSCTPGPSGTS